MSKMSKTQVTVVRIKQSRMAKKCIRQQPLPQRTPRFRPHCGVRGPPFPRFLRNFARAINENSYGNRGFPGQGRES
jgi:hypothetical protein